MPPSRSGGVAGGDTRDAYAPLNAGVAPVELRFMMRNVHAFPTSNPLEFSHRARRH
jgi:hypothetical protein